MRLFSGRFSCSQTIVLVSICDRSLKCCMNRLLEKLHGLEISQGASGPSSPISGHRYSKSYATVGLRIISLCLCSSSCTVDTGFIASCLSMANGQSPRLLFCTTCLTPVSIGRGLFHILDSDYQLTSYHSLSRISL